MTVDMTLSPKEQLAELQRSAQQSSASLVELELDPERKLLEEATLEGMSADRRSQASALSAELWRRQGLLEDLLARAQELGRGRRSEQLAALLERPSIDLGRAAIEPAARSLLTAEGQLCSPAELLAEMTAMFDEVKGVYGLFARTWEALIPQLESLRRLAQETSTLADANAGEERERLEVPLAAVAALARAVARDPLSVRPEGITALEDDLESRRGELERFAELRNTFPVALADAQARLEALGEALAEARAAREELFAKIAQPAAPPLPEFDETLQSELSGVRELAEHGAWSDAARSLDALRGRIDAALDETQSAIDAHRAPIAARNQLRALLDAYRVKSSRLGLIEDSNVASIYREAEAALYTAPTDLADAERLIRRYQEALSDPRTREVER
jgi:hypothetical protein